MGRPKGSRNKPRLQLTSPPAHDGKKPTASERMRQLKRRVALCVHAGQSPETIAAVLEMDVSKLRVVFARELEHGAAIVEAEERWRLDESAAAGKVAASKLILDTAEESGSASGQSPADGIDARSSNVRALRILNGGRSDN